MIVISTNNNKIFHFICASILRTTERHVLKCISQTEQHQHSNKFKKFMILKNNNTCCGLILLLLCKTQKKSQLFSVPFLLQKKRFFRDHYLSSSFDLFECSTFLVRNNALKRAQWLLVDYSSLPRPYEDVHTDDKSATIYMQLHY